MIEKTYYIENTNTLNEVLDNIINSFPCFVDREFIEMNYSKVTINTREEDIASIERILAPLV